MANTEFGTVVLPGARLCTVKEHASGPGTYEYKGFVYASLAGVMKIVEDEVQKREMIIVESPKTPGILPKPGDIVTAKVTMVNSRVVQCAILCVGSSVLIRTYRGIIKKEEIRSVEKDKVDPYKCFRPGDIILARVMPLAEVHCYHLSTAEDGLGVAIATAEGVPDVNMIPINWTEMQCPKTFVIEPRKVARILPENIDDILSGNGKSAVNNNGKVKIEK